MSAHYLNLEGARTINTSWFRLTQHGVTEIAEELAMGAFTATPASVRRSRCVTQPPL